jgi:SAM-dependent methyltransferase
MSDDTLDDEAPPEIPDISSDPEVAPIPSLPSDLPPSMPRREAKVADDELDVEVDVEVPESGEEVEPESGEAIEPEPVVPPPRKRAQTNPATPIARASMPAPPGDAPAPGSLKPPPVPNLNAPSNDDDEDLERTVRRAPAPDELADDLDEPTTKMGGEAGAVRPIPPPAVPGSVPPPRPVSQPPRPVSQPPRPVSQPPRPVSQPPRPVSQPPPPPSAAGTARYESEPPTEPWHAPPEPHGDAATSYPPPPPEPTITEAAPDAPPVSVKPMRVIGVRRPPEAPAGSPAEPAPPSAEAAKPAAPPPPSVEAAKPAAPPPPSVEAAKPAAPPAAPRPPPADGAKPAAPPAAPVGAAPAAPPLAAPSAEELSEDDFAPASSESVDDGEISFPVDDAGDEASAAEELTDDDIAVAAERESEPEIPVDVEEEKPAPPPPPPPRREPPKAPSVAEAVEAQRTRQRKAWWEELFGEDFARASGKLKSPQIVVEADFIEESLGVAKGGVLLDLACGGGQHAVELAQRGYGVVGYDLSLYQLAVAADCAQEYGQKLNLLQGDMREMAFEEMFDGIYCWNTSFGYFEEEKNLAVAAKIFRALRPGGMFLLDVANRDFVVANQPAQTWFEGDACVCMDDMAVDFITSRLRVKRSLILDDGRTMECSYSIRLYSLHELGKMLHDVGFRVTEASGHPSTPGVFFGASSPRILILAQRP